MDESDGASDWMVRQVCFRCLMFVWRMFCLLVLLLMFSGESQQRKQVENKKRRAGRESRDGNAANGDASQGIKAKANSIPGDSDSLEAPTDDAS
jgi:hypothetical protein